MEERIKEQDSPHNGGNYWIGTGGTSELGHSGKGQTGIRIGGNSTMVELFLRLQEKENTEILEMMKF